MNRSTRSMLMAGAAVAATLSLTFASVAAEEDTAEGESMDKMEAGLFVRDAWTRESPMLDLAGAAYMVIHNSTDADDALVGVSSPAAAVVELHLSSMDDEGMMSMNQVVDIPVAAHADAVLEPGGYHLMLIDLVEPLAEGTEVELNLEFMTAEPQSIMAPVMSGAPMMGDMDMDDDMSHDDDMDMDDDMDDVDMDDASEEGEEDEGSPRHLPPQRLRDHGFGASTMLAPPLPASRSPMHRLFYARRGAITLVTLLMTTLLVSSSWSAAFAQERDDGLTWAPLVTPPPVTTPPYWSPTDEVEGFAMGDPGAPVVIEVWEDFQCPYCQRFTYEVEPSIVEQYVETGEARLVFRNLAFLGDESQWAAVAASLAADQDMFWPFHDYLFANFGGDESGSFHIDRLLEMGEVVGLDMEQFREGLELQNARARWSEIEAVSRAEAFAQGINATPTVVVNGVPLGTPDFATIADAVDIELAKVATESASDSGAEAEESEEG